MVAPKGQENEISRDRLAELLNEDLCREYQAIIAYVVYSQVLKVMLGCQRFPCRTEFLLHRECSSGFSSGFPIVTTLSRRTILARDTAIGRTWRPQVHEALVS